MQNARGQQLQQQRERPCGVQQGDPIAGLLFDVYIDQVVREAMRGGIEGS